MLELSANTAKFNYIPVQMGRELNFHLYGGPFTACRNPDTVKINLALENQMPFDYGLHIPDFGVPTDKKQFESVVMMALHHGLTGDEVFVGCGAGLGRTGTFLSCVAKVMLDYKKRVHLKGRGEHPIHYVRRWYDHGAVETGGQVRFIEEFDTRKLVDWYQASRELYDGLGQPVFHTPVMDTSHYTASGFMNGGKNYY